MGSACSAQPRNWGSSTPTVNLLLLGGANAGKSTFFKQMRVLYLSGFGERDRLLAKDMIFENILEALVDLDLATDVFGVDVLEENEDLADDLKAVLHQFKVRDISKQLEGVKLPWEVIERLWRDPGIQSAYQEFQQPTLLPTAATSERTLPVSTGYFLQQLDRIRRDGYVPSDDDMLHLRRSTKLSDSISFKMQVTSLIGTATTLCINCTDVGGQAQERSEWAKYSEKVNAILYVVSLAEFCNVTKADGNMLQKQLDILATVRQTECFQHAPIIVLLNKVDLLENKLQGLKVDDFFPEYTGNSELANVVAFFKTKVCAALGQQLGAEEVSQDGNILTSCATNTQLMRTVLQAIGRSLLQKTLSDARFFG
jgi:guanine nucleotide-binding protein G(i) subunit alpha